MDRRSTPRNRFDIPLLDFSSKEKALLILLFLGRAQTTLLSSFNLNHPRNVAVYVLDASITEPYSSE